MKIQILGSGSSGNSYIIYNDTEAIIIDAGVPVVEIKKAVDFNISKIKGCLICHVHLDHSRFEKKIVELGIKTYITSDSKIKNHPFTEILEHKKKIILGGFEVIPLTIKHDVETFMFLIRHEETGSFIYLSDGHYCPYKFGQLNNALIEVNYDINILNENVSIGKINFSLRNRIINSHMELQTVKDMLKSMDLKKMNSIILLHLSSANSHADRFKREITELTGKRVTIAEAGLVMDFNKEF